MRKAILTFQGLICALMSSLLFLNSGLCLDCPKPPEQLAKDWEVQVEGAVAKIGPVKGGELKNQTKRVTQDLLGKLPDAEKVYLEQMMFSSYCSALRDDKNMSEGDKAKNLLIYRDTVRKTISGDNQFSSRRPSSQVKRGANNAGKNILKTTYLGYRPTGSFETEFRYFMDITGARRFYEQMQRKLLIDFKMEEITRDPEKAEEIIKFAAVAEKEAIKIDEIIPEILPIYQKHFSLTEIQELNKIFSTKVMQDMIKKQPLIFLDAEPIAEKMGERFIERLKREWKSAQVSGSELRRTKP